MGRRGRRPHPDILTPREWEVIDLLRERLTNEEIAQRLGITLDGAKYHVSQILSKLGVSTRDEAAAVVLAEQRPWWLRAAFWAKIAGAATVTAAVAGLAILAWGVVRTKGDDDASSPSFANALSGKIVYLAPADQSQWIATQALLDAAGILVIQDADQFRSQADAIQAKALIVDKEYAGQLESAWLQSNFNDGKVLVGARINISELGQLLGVSGCESSPGFGYYPESRLFYSRCSRHICENGESGGTGQDYLDRNPVGQFRVLIAGIASAAAAPCGGAGAAQPVCGVSQAPGEKAGPLEITLAQGVVCWTDSESEAGYKIEGSVSYVRDCEYLRELGFGTKKYHFPRDSRQTPRVSSCRGRKTQVLPSVIA